MGATHPQTAPLGALSAPAAGHPPPQPATIREVQPPESGWSDESLIAALEPQRSYVDSFAPVEAYLGELCIGSTET